MADETSASGEIIATPVVVAGAGPGGVMTALTLAKKGFKVLVIEKKPRERAGKPIRVSLERDVFAQVGLPPPEPPELIAPPLARELISPDGKSKLRLRQAPLVSVQLDALVTRLIGLAEAQGVRFMFETAVTGPRIESGRVTGVVGTTADGRLLEISSQLAVDASGVNGALRHHLEPEMGVTLEIDPRDAANAWQETREIDRPAVLDLLERNRVRPQVNVTRLGFRGPYSMLAIYVNMDEDQVEVTAGVQHEGAVGAARELAEGYTLSHQWIGPVIRAGGGLVPVRRPLDNFVAAGFACVGDAACQAIPLHASGVASALAAGMVLGETAAQALEEGDVSRRSLWSYNVKYMMSRGAAQANSELFRKFIHTLSADETSLLFAQRLVNEEAVAGSLEGLALEVPLSAVAAAVLSLYNRPGLLLRLARLGRASSRVLDLYSQYPDEYDPSRFQKWQTKVERLFAKW